MKRILGWMLAAMAFAGLPAAAQGKDGDATPVDDKAAAAAEKEAKKQREEASKKCIEEFKKSLKESKTVNERAAAIRVLGECEAKDAKIVGQIAQFLSPMTGDTDFLMTTTATEALGNFKGDKMAVSALMQAAGQHKKNQRVLEKILAALGETGSEPAMPMLLDYLKDNDGKVAAAAARGLGSLKVPASVDPLIKVLERLERDNKLSSDTNPGGKGGNAGVDEANKSLRERYSIVAPAVKDALKSITGENLPFVEDWQEWWGKNRGTFGKPKKEEGEKK